MVATTFVMSCWYSGNYASAWQFIPSIIIMLVGLLFCCKINFKSSIWGGNICNTTVWTIIGICAALSVGGYQGVLNGEFLFRTFILFVVLLPILFNLCGVGSAENIVERIDTYLLLGVCGIGMALGSTLMGVGSYSAAFFVFVPTSVGLLSLRWGQ